jgi:AcrR family transcriptional regulator
MTNGAVLTKKRPPAASRPDLVATAIDCFALHGYQGTTIDMIARAAGVTKGALYYHFKDKEDLLFAALRDRVSDFEERVVAAVTPVEDPIRALRQIGDACLFVATRNNHRRFLLTLMVEAIDSNPQLANQFREIMQRFRAFVAGIVRIGQQQQVFRFDVEPDAAAAILVAGIMGAEIQHYQDSTAVNLEDVVRSLLEATCAWLSARAASQQLVGDRAGTPPASADTVAGRLEAEP